MNPKYSRYYTYIKPIINSKAVKTYSPIVFSIITITIFSLYAIRPTVKTILSLQISITEQSQVLEKLNEKSKNLTEGKANYQKIDPAIKNRLNILLPPSTSLPQLITNLNNLSRSNQASISGIQFQPIDLDGPPITLSKNATLKIIELSLNVQGSFVQLNEFLKSIKSMDRMLEIKSLNISRTQDGGLIMSVTANAFYLKN